MEYLLDIFCLLVQQIPGNMVLFCFIDGISFYDRLGGFDETRNIVQTMTQIGDNLEENGPVFKLLITSPLHDRCAKQYFPPKDHIVVPTNAGNGQILTVAQVMIYTRTVPRNFERILPEEVESEREDDYEQNDCDASDTEES